MLRLSLHRCLRGVRETSTGDTENDFSADNSGLGRARKSTSVSDQKTKGDHEQTTTEDDKGLELSDSEDDETEQSTGDNGGERVERSNSGGGLDALVESNDQDRVQVCALHIPCKVEDGSDTETGPDTSVPQQLERNEWVSGLHLPKDEEGNAAEADDQRSDNVTLFPSLLHASGQGQGNEDEGEDGDHQDKTDDVQLPEKLLDETDETVVSERRFVVGQDTRSSCSSLSEEEGDDKGQTADRVDDGPHADTPVPGSGSEDGGGNITRNPGVDLRWRTSVGRFVFADMYR